MTPKNHLGTEDPSSSSWTLKYRFVSPNNNSDFLFSFDPKDSDFIQNTTILNSLVGTLVKYDKNGRIAPYLADSFVTSEDKLRWKFKLRNNLTCQSGELIDAGRYAKVLTRQLRTYADMSDALDFENLKGWQQFKENKKSAKIDGLYVQDDFLVFDFDKAPSDLLEFLRMPYFGFWCEANFDQNNKWIDDKKILSSGSYVLDSLEPGKKITLKKRDSWFSVGPDSPQTIEFGVEQIANIANSKATTIHEFSRKNDYQSDPESFYEIQGTPTVLLSIVLSPSFNGFFKDPQNRKAFLQRARKHQNQFARLNSRFFYFNAKSDFKEEPSVNYKKTDQKKVIFAVASTKFDEKDVGDLKQLIKLTLQDSGLDFEILIDDPHKEAWYQKVDSNEHFDGRIAIVDIGGYVINAAIKMMFCSKMGINFPDPSGRVCKLVTEQDIKRGEISQDYVDRLNRAVMEDASVIPLYHYGFRWLASHDIDAGSVSSVSMTPLFEEIRQKK